MALLDPDRPFSVVCDAWDFDIDSALLQIDVEAKKRVNAFEFCQLKAADKSYPIHDKELLAMKYALVIIRVHLLGSKPFVINTDHASLRAANQSLQLSQSMARWHSLSSTTSRCSLSPESKTLWLMRRHADLTVCLLMSRRCRCRSHISFVR